MQCSPRRIWSMQPGGGGGDVAGPDPRYLSDPDDVQTLIRGMKTAYKIAKDSPAFNAIAECIIMNDAAVAVADSGKEIVDDDAFLEGFIRDTCGTLYGHRPLSLANPSPPLSLP